MTTPPGAQAASTPEATAAVAQSRPGEGGAGTRPVTSPRGGTAREGEHFVVSDGVARAAQTVAYERKTHEPIYRPLRVYALDPAAPRRDGSVAVVNVPYEPLRPGPTGCLLEIIDGDERGRPPAGGLDLDDRLVLLRQGRDPSPSEPQFRAQMVYAVCSTTYAAFRQALGRQVGWGFARGPGAAGEPARLRIRPHAERARNAYYDKLAGEIRFGYYEADAVVQGRNLPRGIVSTCLSHDIVVHEMSHALLDGLRAHFTLPSNPDVLALHEAFADLVALFQRFTYKDVVRAAVRSARGDLCRAGLLTGLAAQFGQTTSVGSALRSAVLGTPKRYGASDEPHELGGVLVAAVFEAFTTVFRLKTHRFVRLATGGTGVLPDGEIPDALQELLAEQASKLASQFLTICIRAIDYCPPVDVTFGEYLRAVITADTDLVPDDRWGYREAWVDAFRHYGIYPPHVGSLSEDALLWQASDRPVPAEPELAFARLQFEGDPGRPAGGKELRRQACALGRVVGDPAYTEAFGCVRPHDPRLDGDEVGLPVIESIRSSRRVGPDGQVVFDLVAEVTQRRTVRPHASLPGFDFYGGATVILDPTGRIRYVIRKSILAADRVQGQRDFLAGGGAQYWGQGPGRRLLPEPQPFRLVHEHTRTSGAVG